MVKTVANCKLSTNYKIASQKAKKTSVEKRILFRHLMFLNRNKPLATSLDLCYNDYRMSKRQKAFSRLRIQPFQKVELTFWYYIIATEIDKFHNEICSQIIDLPSKCFEFRLSIVVIIKRK